MHDLYAISSTQTLGTKAFVSYHIFYKLLKHNLIGIDSGEEPFLYGDAKNHQVNHPNERIIGLYSH